MSTKVVPQPSKTDFANAVWNAMGNLSVAAKSLSITTLHARDLAKKWPDIEQHQTLARRQLVDRAEFVIADHLRRGSLDAAKFVLKTLGKNRGYTENPEIQTAHQIVDASLPGGQPVNITIKLDDNGAMERQWLRRQKELEMLRDHFEQKAGRNGDSDDQGAGGAEIEEAEFTPGRERIVPALPASSRPDEDASVPGSD